MLLVNLFFVWVPRSGVWRTSSWGMTMEMGNGRVVSWFGDGQTES
jgi:hypothetical protein